MANPLNFKDDFDSLASGGAIGSPSGLLAYAYLRVSSSGQAEEGRSGLPRQLRHIHEIALQKGYRIPWNMIFADDHTGFEFDDRPQLLQLRKEYTSKKRRAAVVVMEYIDRLSRNADWHQGFLLDEMKRNDITPIFWKAFTSRIERSIMGAMAQDGMENDKQRMWEGTLHKARNGYITAKTAAYGYRLVDPKGNTGMRAKKQTCYGIDPEQAAVVREIFDAVAYTTVPLHALGLELNSKYPPPKKMKDWEINLIKKIITNPLYKGEFYANRVQEYSAPAKKMEGLPSGKPSHVKKRRLRPPEEWIRIDVPAVVTPELWEAANLALEARRAAHQRSSQNVYLLRGLLECAACGRVFAGQSGLSRRISSKGEKVYKTLIYRCSSQSSKMENLREEIDCRQPQISARVLENAVWSLVYTVLLDPSILTRAIEDQYSSEPNMRLMEQIAFLENEITEKGAEDQSLWKAYRAGVFDDDEYKARREAVKEVRARLSNQVNELRARMITLEDVEEQKRETLAMCTAVQKAGSIVDAPFSVKYQVIRMMISRIILDTRAQTMKIEGVIQGIFPISRNSKRPTGPSR